MGKCDARVVELDHLRLDGWLKVCFGVGVERGFEQLQRGLRQRGCVDEQS